MNELMVSHSRGSGQVPVCTLSDSTLGEMRHANQCLFREEERVLLGEAGRTCNSCP